MGSNSPEITYTVEWSDEYECDVFRYYSGGCPALPHGLPSVLGIDSSSGRRVFQEWLDERGRPHRDDAHAFEHFGDDILSPHRKWFHHGELTGTQKPIACLECPDEVWKNERFYVPEHIHVVYGEEIDPPSLTVNFNPDPEP